jgi:hypothetical protein
MVYRDHARDPERPKWLKVKGAHLWKPRDLARTQLRFNWNDYLNVMIGRAGLIEKKILTTKPVPKKKGPKPKTTVAKN